MVCLYACICVYISEGESWSKSKNKSGSRSGSGNGSRSGGKNKSKWKWDRKYTHACKLCEHTCVSVYACDWMNHVEYIPNNIHSHSQLTYEDMYLFSFCRSYLKFLRHDSSITIIEHMKRQSKNKNT